jgi:hypothetical protein
MKVELHATLNGPAICKWKNQVWINVVRLVILEGAFGLDLMLFFGVLDGIFFLILRSIFKKIKNL